MLDLLKINFLSRLKNDFHMGKCMAVRCIAQDFLQLDLP